MSTKKETNRYLIVRPFTGSLDFGFYFFLILWLPPSASKAISYIIANTAGYLLDKYWIFKRKRSSYHEAGRYFLVDVFLFACNVITNQGILNVWPRAIFLALVTSAIVTMLMSFFLKKCWVFKKA